MPKRRPTSADIFGQFLENLQEAAREAAAASQRPRPRDAEPGEDPEETAWKRAVAAAGKRGGGPASLRDVGGRRRPAPAAAADAASPAAKAAPKAARPAAAAKGQAAPAKRRGAAKPAAPAPAPAAQGGGRYARFLRAKPANLRDALVLAEIVGKPLSLREPF